MYGSFWKPIEHLSDEQLGRLFRAIFIYQTEGEEVEVSQDIAVAYYFMINQFNIDKKKYERIVEARTVAGRKGGRRTQENARANRANANFAQANQPDNIEDMLSSVEKGDGEKGDGEKGDREKGDREKGEGRKEEGREEECCYEGDPALLAGDAPDKNQLLVLLKELFFFRNILNPQLELQLFVGYYGSQGWKTRDGNPLWSLGQRVRKIRTWCVQECNAQKRFPDKFLNAWYHLWCAAPDDLKMLMMEDDIVIDTQYTPEVAVHPEVAKWLNGKGRDFKAGILDDEWQGGKKVRIVTYVPGITFEELNAN